MIHRKILLGVPMLVLGLLCTGALAQGTDDDLQGLARPGGNAVGLYDLPSTFRPGRMTGVLTGQHGKPKFAIDGIVFPGGPFGRGVILGQAVHLDGPFRGDSVPMRGVWVHEGARTGHFDAVLLRRGDDENPHLDPFLEIEGGYRDPNGPIRPPGTFRGRWELLP